MMEIKQLIDNETGKPIVPVTHTKAVTNDLGESLETVLGRKAEKTDIPDSVVDIQEFKDFELATEVRLNNLSTAKFDGIISTAIISDLGVSPGNYKIFYVESAKTFAAKVDNNATYFNIWPTRDNFLETHPSTKILDKLFLLGDSIYRKNSSGGIEIISKNFTDKTEEETIENGGKYPKGTTTFNHGEVFNDTSNLAIGENSHAEGYNNRATGLNSHVEGTSNNSKGENSHAEGGDNKAFGNQSHAEGLSCAALGGNSHAEGKGTRADNLNQHVQGSYNTLDQNPSPNDYNKSNITFSIGNGTSVDNRSDALKMLGDGTTWISGIGGFTGTNSNSTNSLQYVIGDVYKIMYNQHAYINLSTTAGNNNIIEKGITKAIRVNWGYMFNGKSITPDTMKLTRTDVNNTTTTPVNNPSTISYNDAISDYVKYVVTGSIDGVEKTKSLTINAYYPKYYGGLNRLTNISEIDFSSLNRQEPITSSASGDYEFSVKANEYAWFCIPSDMTINKVTSGGFDVPIEAPIEVVTSNKGTYKCYRSVESFKAGMFKCHIS